MKVKIIKSRYETYWYSNKIGKIFDVTKMNSGDYRVKNSSPICFINFDDCVDITKEGKTFDQKQSCADVVTALKRRSKRGLSVGEYSDMGRGCDMRKRISELVRDGYTFRTAWEPNKTTTGRHKRYWLLSYKREK